MPDVLILGAGTAGLTAAICARQAGRRVLVLEQEARPGDPALLPEALALGVCVEREQARALLPGPVLKVRTDLHTHACARVIIATGQRPRGLDLPGEAALLGRGLGFQTDAVFGDAVAVVGGGDRALLCAEQLADRGAQVHLIHRTGCFRGSPALLAELTARSNVRIHPFCRVTGYLGFGRLTGLRLAGPGGTRALRVSGCVLCVGGVPNTEPFRDVLDVDASGYLRAGEDCRTKLAGVYAAGDCRTKPLRGARTAAADGAVAAFLAAKKEELC